ncbi:MAG: aminoacetone oxidase family FAD-binding enzyme [Clostridia bacterium]|nr:aminoacetone oxidase family FAD-binding enzyme [Clostridia bacterium]
MKKIAIIGGGAAGMACAVLLARKGYSVTILERGERLGRKLAATGNGQGNVTNTDMGASHYFSDDNEKVGRLLSRFGYQDTVRFLESMGGIFLPDSRGRVYPAGRQASAVVDLFRFELERLHVEICLKTQVKKIAYKGGFLLEWEGGHINADAVVLTAGGKAAPKFLTDGTAYALVKDFGHVPTPLEPSLVRLKCDRDIAKRLRGIRIDSGLKVIRAGKEIYETRGDTLFTDSGISGDAVFRASAHAKAGDQILLDFLPDISYERAREVVTEKGLYCVVNNGLARVLEYVAKGDKGRIAELLKAFPLTVEGKEGFSEAQVTKGGIRLSETDENLMSRFQKGLYFAGEILNADGECGGYNLQWAFTSAFAVSEGICS